MRVRGQATEGSTVFEIIRRPVTLPEVYSGGALIDDVSVKDGLDAFIPVVIDRAASNQLRGECSILCFPRAVTLEITYYQVDTELKRVVKSVLILEQFDRNKDLDTYSLTVSFSALNYLQLIIAFAFDQLTYIFLFIFVGALTVFGTMVYWLVHRVLTRLDPPPRFRFFSFFSIVTPAPVLGVAMGLIPVLIMLAGCHVLINGDMVLGGVTRADLGEKLWMLDGLYGHFTDTEVDVTAIPMVRAGRMGILFMAIASCLLVLGVKTFIPKEVSKLERELRLKGEGDESLWRPTLWKRANMLLVSFVYSLFLVCIVEFSFWPGFGIYVWLIQVALFLLNIVLGLVLESLLKEALLMVPFGAAFSAVVGMATLGSSDFADFIISYGVGCVAAPALDCPCACVCVGVAVGMPPPFPLPPPSPRTPPPPPPHPPRVCVEGW